MCVCCCVADGNIQERGFIRNMNFHMVLKQVHAHKRITRNMYTPFTYIINQGIRLSLTEISHYGNTCMDDNECGGGELYCKHYYNDINGYSSTTNYPYPGYSSTGYPGGTTYPSNTGYPTSTTYGTCECYSGYFFDTAMMTCRPGIHYSFT